MSNSRFVLKQAHVRGTGSSDLVRYVARSKLHEEREGKTARLLFTDRADNLTISEAQKWLSITGGRLQKEDVLHYILSFEDGREYKLLGNKREERQAEITHYVRRALVEGFKEIDVEEMRWVAGLHLNTGNPHVHLLLNKHAISRETQDLTRIPKLTAPLIAHYRLQPDKTRVFSYGTIINSFAAQVDVRHRDRARILQYESPLRSVKFTRELLSLETLRTRQPTVEERLIGSWIVAEMEAARGLKSLRIKSQSQKDSTTKIAHEAQREKTVQSDLTALRTEVARLDHIELLRGQKPLAAFIETEDLRSILTSPLRGLIIATDEKSLRLEKTLEHDFTHQLEHIVEPSRAKSDHLTIVHDSSAKEHSTKISPLIRSR